MADIASLGSRALLVTDQSLPPAHLALWLDRLGLDGVREVVPAATSVTIIFESPTRCSAAAHHLRPLLEDPVIDAVLSDPTAAEREIALHCCFDGPDLEAVAEISGLSAAEVITALTTANLRVEFCGFSPGFAYLAGLPSVLHLPRRARPRQRVDAGSLAIGSRYAAVYPTSTPGGWHIVGSTDAEIWRLDRTPPALLAPGVPVRLCDASADRGFEPGG
jgi:KipI family sensor histidine kinase inhibitor